MILRCDRCGVLCEVSRRIRPRQRCEDCEGRLQIVSIQREGKIKAALERDQIRCIDDGGKSHK